MKKPALLLSLLLTALALYGQDETSTKFQNKNSVQLELAGPAIFYSLNYERIIVNGNRFKTAVQAGFSYYPPSTGMRDIWIPIGVNEIFSMGSHHIEAGVGYMPVIEASRDEDLEPREWMWSNLMTARIGYRYQKPDGRLIIRAAFTPVFELGSIPNGDYFHPLGGASVGYAF